MAHLPDLISDLALILIVAGVVTILFKWLKQPVVLGYIVAGFFVGTGFVDVLKEIFTNTGGGKYLSLINYYPQVLDTSSIHTWSEIGVIFLLFALGLEFSFKKLMEVGGTASIATIINMGSMIVIGYIVGQLLGWSQMNSIFLGGMLSMSSTTIIIKAFNDMGLQKKKFASIVFGMLIVEDLAAILMMVLLSTVAQSHNVGGMVLLDNVLKLIFFMMIWFVGGIYLIPTFLKKFKSYLNDETLLIIAVGLCLGMVLFANFVNFSSALGAFIMGSILAETIEAKRIEHLIEPLKNLFGAVFFVSVGMMIAPAVLVEHAGTILLLTVIVLIGRIIFATIGVSASGQGLKVAVQSGFSLAQIGEFSFIIATLGISLGVMDAFLYPVIVAVSVITTFTTPYCIKYSTNAYSFLEKHIPSKWDKLITGYASANYKSINDQTTWNKLLKSILSSVAVYFCISVAILLICNKSVIPFVTSNVPDVWGRILSAAITLTLMAPFMRAIIMKKNRSKEFRELWSDDKHFNKGALISLLVFRTALCMLLILIVLIPLFPSATVLMVIISLAIIIFIIYSQGFKNQSRRMEARFLENLNMKEVAEAEKQSIRKEFANDLLSKNVHIEDYDIPQNSDIVGKTLRDLNFKQKTGVNIVRIIRGSQKINIPDGNEYLFPMDKIVVIGSDDELQTFEQMIDRHHGNETANDTSSDEEYIDMSQYIVENDSFMIGKSIRELNIREKTECMIIAIDRDEQAIMDINADTVLMVDDVLWIAGEVSKMEKFGENMEKTS
ncbi:cation:proton antiporter [Dysgonomonas sp. 520]|uniref:cation:proton antiporter n=1 Tax=Dysgonomonas sp. 520 TaxID=2302931 RepID=UPI0013D53227|nr:cation:proton antiporter [Dysgonomonas sp. 520]NDW08093.1 sodium:proton antiporter [Dysgonomonas sp. 520]